MTENDNDLPLQPDEEEEHYVVPIQSEAALLVSTALQTLLLREPGRRMRLTTSDLSKIRVMGTTLHITVYDDGAEIELRAPEEGGHDY